MDRKPFTDSTEYPVVVYRQHDGSRTKVCTLPRRPYWGEGGNDHVVLNGLPYPVEVDEQGEKSITIYGAPVDE